MKNDSLKLYQKLSQNKSFIMSDIESLGEHSEELHWHTSIEFLYIYQGKLSLQMDSQVHTLKEADVVFIDSARNHALTYAPNTRILSLKISAVWLNIIIPKFFKEELVLCSPTITTIAEREAAADFSKTFLLLKDVFFSEETFADIGINGYIFILLYNLMSNFRGNKNIESKYKYDIRLKQTIQYLHTHYRDDIHLQELADMLYVSPQYISKLFHNYYSMTFKQYLTKIRLEHSVYEMQHTENTLLDIALNCGFSSQHSFIDAFKKCYHMTPTEFKTNKNI